MSESRTPAEQQRLRDAAHNDIPWKKWGPYLSERQWGGVRENLDRNVEAWNDVTHDQSRSRAYVSGEDGIAGWSDANMLLCFALGLWNGKDPILKERMFGLTNSEGNHGEDVKEYYFYSDSTPTHAYAKMLYKYPQAEYPYEQLVSENRRRTRTDFEYELLDTGVFDDDRYWDVFAEFAKADPEDICIRITAANRGPEPWTLHLVPQLWFRNTWWSDDAAPRPEVAGRAPRPLRGHLRAPRAAGAAVPVLRRRRRAAVHRQRDQPLPAVGPAQPDDVPEGRHQRLHRQRPAGRREPRAQGDEVRVPHDGHGRPRAERDAAPAPDRPPPRRAGRSVRRLRPHVRRPQARSRRVLRRRHPRQAQRRRHQRRAPGLRRAAVDETGVRLQRRGLAERARCAPGRHGRRPQPALVPSLRHRRHLDAGQVGVPVVRRVGPGLPRRVVRVHRPVLRARAAVADAARSLPAPERPAPRLRVELR